MSPYWFALCADGDYVLIFLYWLERNLAINPTSLRQSFIAELNVSLGTKSNYRQGDVLDRREPHPPGLARGRTGGGGSRRPCPSFVSFHFCFFGHGGRKNDRYFRRNEKQHDRLEAKPRLDGERTFVQIDLVTSID